MESIQQLLSEHNLVLNSELLPIIDQAEQGDFTAMCEACSMFADGLNNVKPNYEMAIRYAKKIMEANYENGDPIIIVEGLSNLAMIEAKFGHEDEAKENFKKAFIQMLDNLYDQNVAGEAHGFLLHIVDQFIE